MRQILTNTAANMQIFYYIFYFVICLFAAAGFGRRYLGSQASKSRKNVVGVVRAGYKRIQQSRSWRQWEDDEEGQQQVACYVTIHITLNRLEHSSSSSKDTT
jgi:hypothetical protein